MVAGGEEMSIDVLISFCAIICSVSNVKGMIATNFCIVVRYTFNAK